MRIERVRLEEAVGHVLVHNAVGQQGNKVVAKGTRLTSSHLERLRAAGVERVEVAVLEPGDIHEDEAAEQLGAALALPHLRVTRGVGGRVNLHTTVRGVLYVDAGRLQAFNELPGLTLATRAPHTVVWPQKGKSQVATLKVIPYAVPSTLVEQATALLPGLLEVRPLPSARAALLLVGEPAAHSRLRQQFEPPTRRRVERLGGKLATVESVPFEEQAIAAMVQRLATTHDLLVIAGQTSIMDEQDLVPRALRAAGATFELHGAPVEPGNLLALAYTAEGRPIMCAPGCARSPAHNVVDLVLPRLLAGERLSRREIAALGLGGLLH